MELIVQKAVELGVYEVVPVVTRRTVVKLDEKKAKKKVERWNTIALSAAKQAKRGRIPEVRPLMTLKEAFSYSQEFDASIIPYEDAKGIGHSRQVLHDLKGSSHIGIFIGITPITLGKRILRTETAGMAVLSILMFEMEEE
jgi:16S rRNA (uracil1498-N3)-methyltransferase